MMKNKDGFWVDKMNLLGQRSEAFVFILDFELINPLVLTMDELRNSGIQLQVPGFSHYMGKKSRSNPFKFITHPLPYSDYLNAFEIVQKNLRLGNTYLTNLTFPTLLETSLNLEELFYYASAPYKLYIPGICTVFSPESFIRISDNYIYTFPMKGTIRADIPEAEIKILKDPKESAEHATVVDLLRNDLSTVASRIEVKRYRYIEKIRSIQADLLQVSSEICGIIHPSYSRHLGNLIQQLLPAGSVSGAPKRQTLKIIREAEGAERGYYTGVFGYYDGKKLESAVMIRFVEEKEGKLYFRSGGGITVFSQPENEYRELIDKVYVPFD